MTQPGRRLVARRRGLRRVSKYPPGTFPRHYKRCRHRSWCRCLPEDSRRYPLPGRKSPRCDSCRRPHKQWRSQAGKRRRCKRLPQCIDFRRCTRFRCSSRDSNRLPYWDRRHQRRDTGQRPRRPSPRPRHRPPRCRRRRWYRRSRPSTRSRSGPRHSNTGSPWPRCTDRSCRDCDRRKSTDTVPLRRCHPLRPRHLCRRLHRCQPCPLHRLFPRPHRRQPSRPCLPSSDRPSISRSPPRPLHPAPTPPDCWTQRSPERRLPESQE
jgi:hypothetical protein